ncbi:MAG: glycosyl transferase, family 2 [Bryobacterales bacterium]|nr:glycosyl transferase, family 2 [Bryobacterales bacterium]
MVSSGLPLVSIVTPSFNMDRYLPRTIDSVLSQDYPKIEYIVMDGGSTDGTHEILRSYGDRLQYFSEPDKGPSDAVHKGFRHAHGEIFAWLGADDIYLPGAVDFAVKALVARPEIDVIYGEGYWIDQHGAVISRYPTLPFDPKILERDCFICQPASFFRAAAYRRCGLDPDVNFSFDYDLWIRMAKQGIRFQMIPQYLAGSRMHHGAKTINERDTVFQASIGLLQQHYGYVPFSWAFGYTAFRNDGRDQFFQPMKYSLRNYLASLPEGLRLNPTKRMQFLGDWLAAPLREIRRRFS